MKNPRLEYLLKLEDFYHSKEAGEFINSKIALYFDKENPIFCYGCSRTFILKVNCTGRFENDKYTITCRNCKAKTILSAKHVQ